MESLPAWYTALQNRFVKDESLIPKGSYCYTPIDIEYGNEFGMRVHIRLCPYWSKREDKSEQQSGFCKYMGLGDWMPNGTFILWDQVKECGINDEIEADWYVDSAEEV